MGSKIPFSFWFFTFGFFFNNCAFNVLTQLQSSINPTVGSVSVSISYATSIFVCLIFVPIMFKATSPRFQFASSSLGYLLFALANFHPTWYTMIPSAVCLGFATGIAWSAATNFVSVISVDYQLTAATLYSIFTGIVQLSSVFGNGIALLAIHGLVNETEYRDADFESILQEDDCVMNEPLYTDNVTTHKPHDLTENGVKLLSIGCSIFHTVATLLLFFGIQGRYKRRNNSHSLEDFTLIMNSLKGMIKQIGNAKQLLIAPITIYSATVLCFIVSDLTRHVITPCLGVELVPLLMIAYGMGISFGCFASSRLLKLLNVKLLMILVGIFDAISFIFLYFWEGIHTLPIIIFLTAGLGFTAGVFESGIPTIYSRLFAGSTEAAFSLWNTLFNIGCCVVFGWSSFLTLRTKLLTLFLTLIISEISLLLITFDDPTEDTSEIKHHQDSKFEKEIS